MCLVLLKLKNISQGNPPEIFARTDLPPPDSSESWHLLLCSASTVRDRKRTLLANQWAERRLVTQWRHDCRAMRRSVCNAGASNAGRSLCVQISRERSYLQPMYWYHSKGNWLRYNFAAESFYNNETLQQTFRPLVSTFSKNDKFRYSIPVLKKLGAP